MVPPVVDALAVAGACVGGVVAAGRPPLSGGVAVGGGLFGAFDAALVVGETTATWTGWATGWATRCVTGGADAPAPPRWRDKGKGCRSAAPAAASGAALVRGTCAAGGRPTLDGLFVGWSPTWVLAGLSSGGPAGGAWGGDRGQNRDAWGDATAAAAALE